MSTMRLAISVSSFSQSALSFPSLSTLATSRAPCSCGFEYMGRTMPLSCDWTFTAVSLSFTAMFSAPVRR